MELTVIIAALLAAAAGLVASSKPSIRTVS